MNIVVLDGHTVNPNDLSWEGFEEIGNLTVYPRSASELVIERAKNVEYILTNKVRLFQPQLDQLPKLKYIGLCATGYDNIDVDYARKKGITVTNIPSYSTPSVAQHTFSLLLELTNRVGLHNRSVHELEWVRSKDFSYFKAPIIELKDKVFGIIGYGAIGKEVAKIAMAFGMQVKIVSNHASSVEIGELVSMEDLLPQVDVLSIHTALNERTKEMINAELLSKMKLTAMVINTSRGAIIDEKALADALNEGRIAAAGIDVLSKEPPTADNPLLSAKNCVVTPHVSWVSKESRLRLMATAVGNFKAFLAGEKLNVV